MINTKAHKVLIAMLYFRISVTKSLMFYIYFYPLSFSPRGGKVLTPSPLGEVPIAIGREGG
jgi:hypothetical protein